MNEARSEENEKNIVFIIDDQATSRIIMESIARTIDDQIEVMSFDNAISALQALQDQQTSKPDLILTDYQMPAMDGVQFIEKIRADGQFNDIPIIIITTLEDREALYNALEAGATDFLVKPVDIHECQVRCRNLLTMQQQKLIISNHAQSLEQKVREPLNKCSCVNLKP